MCLSISVCFTPRPASCSANMCCNSPIIVSSLFSSRALLSLSIPLLLLLFNEFRDAANAVNIDLRDFPDLMLTHSCKRELHDDQVLHEVFDRPVLLRHAISHLSPACAGLIIPC